MGAPVGSLLIGPRDFIKKARRIRKVFGGGMRQAGFLAAAGLYALEHQVSRLAEDHKHAKLLGKYLESRDFVGELLPVETNILIFEVRGKYTAPELAAKFKEQGIFVIPISPKQVRMVVHLDISADDVQRTIDVINSL